jgi:hypothetical protein
MNIEIPDNKPQIQSKSQFAKFKFSWIRNQSFEFGICYLESLIRLFKKISLRFFTLII